MINPEKCLLPVILLLSVTACTDWRLHIARNLDPGHDPAAPGFGSVLVADARPQPVKGSPKYKVGAPYMIDGKRYFPAESPGHDEIGIASWYGREFNGKRTANGEIFDENLITAAHRTLPMPSYVEVYNLENNRKAIVRVNDRGPFARDRILDASKALATKLGFHEKGLAKVRVRFLQEDSTKLAQRMQTSERTGKHSQPVIKTPVLGGLVALPDLNMPAPAKLPAVARNPVSRSQAVSDEPAVFTEPGRQPVSRYWPAGVYVQVGTFQDPANVERIISRVHAVLTRHTPAFTVEAKPMIGEAGMPQVNGTKKPLHRVRIGPVQVSQAQSLAYRLKEEGINELYIVTVPG